MSTNILRQQAGLQTKETSPMMTINRFLQDHKAQIAAALPQHLNADRMARLAMTALSQNRALAECDARSVFGAVVIASQLGLEIGVNGQCYLVPYKGRATLIPGWQGLMDLVARAGRGSAWTGAVYAGDDFDWGLGDAPFIKHKPSGNDAIEDLQYVYAVGRVKDSPYPIIEVWPNEKIWRHRDRYNKVGSKHYSYQHPEMYARKVALLQVLKYLPKSIELSAAVQIANRDIEGTSVTIDKDFIVTESETINRDTGEINETGPEVVAETRPLIDSLVLDAKSAESIEALDYVRSKGYETLTDSGKLILSAAIKKRQDFLAKGTLLPS